MLFPRPYLPPGSKGPAVVVLQLMLKVAGFNSAIYPDGEFGEQTAFAVRSFQESVGIEADGCFGPATRAAFHQHYGINVDTLSGLGGETTVPQEVSASAIVEPVEPLNPYGSGTEPEDAASHAEAGSI